MITNLNKLEVELICCVVNFLCSLLKRREGSNIVAQTMSHDKKGHAQEKDDGHGA